MRRSFEHARAARPRSTTASTTCCARRSSSSCPAATWTRSGTVHRVGSMRLATARDELVPLADDRVRENPAYLTVVLLARVVERLGTVTDVHPGVIENLFASDLAFLQDLYRRVNQEGHARAGGRHARRAAGVHGRSDRWSPGGIVTYGEEALWDELAFVGAHYHWSLAEILDLEHATRGPLHPRRRRARPRTRRRSPCGRSGDRNADRVRRRRRAATPVHRVGPARVACGRAAAPVQRDAAGDDRPRLRADA